MTQPPRKLLNRFLLILIGLMTSAIFVLGALIVWRVLSPAEAGTGESESQTARRFDISSATIAYIAPEGCADQIRVVEDRIEATFTGAACDALDIQEVSGKVSLTID